MAVNVTVTGLAEVQKALNEAPRLIVANAYLKAMAAAVEVIERQFYISAPEREDNVLEEGEEHLRDSITHIIELDSQFRGAVAAVGFGREGKKALWLEYGHRIVTHKPAKKQEGVAEPHPFVRKAFEACKDRAFAALTETLQAELGKMYG